MLRIMLVLTLAFLFLGCKSSSNTTRVPPVAQPSQPVMRVAGDKYHRIAFLEPVRLEQTLAIDFELLPEGRAFIDRQLNYWRELAATQPAATLPDDGLVWRIISKPLRNRHRICRQIQICRRDPDVLSQSRSRELLFERHDFVDSPEHIFKLTVSSDDWQEQLPAWRPSALFIPGELEICIDYFVRWPEGVTHDQVCTLSFTTSTKIESPN